MTIPCLNNRLATSSSAVNLSYGPRSSSRTISTVVLLSTRHVVYCMGKLITKFSFRLFQQPSLDPDDVSITVKAFLQADLPIELIELLEKIVLEPSPFSDNKNLQNLLLLTAIRADKGKVVSYINKLQNYDAGEIARIAIEHGLHEEALSIYKKHEQHALAINVLVELVSIDRGLEYATKVNLPEVWSRLAKAQLDGLRVKDSIGQSNTVCIYAPS